MNLEKLLEHPAYRRGWLLLKALECAPLDQAIGLARTADQFLLGDVHNDANLRAAVTTTAKVIPAENQGEAEVSGEDERPKQSSIALAPSRRNELLDRAAKGATNAELAAEFGLTPRQVQGLRMGAARRPTRPPLDDAKTPDETVSATVDDVVRYLRQQDDVVVSDGNGAFLVNGRLRLDLSELVAKANRARRRQNKPLFRTNGITQGTAPDAVGNGHPMFWTSPAKIRQ
jgi:hypothetical protein